MRHSTTVSQCPMAPASQSALSASVGYLEWGCVRAAAAAPVIPSINWPRGKERTSLWGLPYMTSAVGGGPKKSRRNKQNQLICDSDKGRRGKKIRGRHIWKPPFLGSGTFLQLHIYRVGYKAGQNCRSQVACTTQKEKPRYIRVTACDWRVVWALF